jgi:hypothetical protein
MLGHASAAMTLDVYAGLFADNLDEVADRLDQAFANLNADQVRTTGRPSGRDTPGRTPPKCRWLDIPRPEVSSGAGRAGSLGVRWCAGARRGQAVVGIDWVCVAVDRGCAPAGWLVREEPRAASPPDRAGGVT